MARFPRRLWRWTWQGLVVAAVLFVLVRGLLLEMPRVPSSSMEPHLHGDPRDGDVLLVVRHWYDWFAPRRFDLAVYRKQGEPGPAAWYVKRIVALAGERILLEDGDLYVQRPGDAGLTLLCKDYDDFERLLVPWTRETFTGDGVRRFQLDPASTSRESQGLHLAGTGSVDAALESCVLAEPVTDGYLDAAGRHHPGGNRVDELLLRLDLEPLAPAFDLLIRLDQGGDEFRFRLESSADGSRVEIEQRRGLDGPRSQAATGPVLVTGRRHRVEVWNVDRYLGLAIDGRVVAGSEHRLVGERPLSDRAARPAFGLLEGSVRVIEAEILRDLHYTTRRQDDSTLFPHAVAEPFTVPEGSVFVLGDNSAESEDSRQSGEVRIADLVGRPVAVWSGSPRRWLH